MIHGKVSEFQIVYGVPAPCVAFGQIFELEIHRWCLWGNKGQHHPVLTRQ